MGVVISSKECSVLLLSVYVLDHAWIEGTGHQYGTISKCLCNHLSCGGCGFGVAGLMYQMADVNSCIIAIWVEWIIRPLEVKQLVENCCKLNIPRSWRSAHQHGRVYVWVRYLRFGLLGISWIWGPSRYHRKNTRQFEHLFVDDYLAGLFFRVSE